MIRMYAYLKHVWWQAILAVILMVTRVTLDMSLPDYMSKIVDQGILNKDLALVWSTGQTMLLISFGVMLLFMSNSLLASYIGSAVGNRLRKELFTKIESFSLVEFDRFSSSSLITRATNDVSQIQQVMTMSFRFMLASPLYAIVAFTKATRINLQMSLIFAFTVPIMFLFLGILFRSVNPHFTLIQKLTDMLNRVSRESLSGIRVIRAFNAQKFQADKFAAVNQDVVANNVTLNRIMSLMDPFLMTILSFTTIAIIWLGSRVIGTGDLKVGQMMAFIQYSAQILNAFNMLTMLFMLWPRATVSAKRIREVLETGLSITDPKDPLPFDPARKGEVVFENVSFRYPDAQENVLEDISFIAKPGTLTAFIGSTGSGKSTLVNLIPRLYDVSSGRILIDGIDIRRQKQTDVRQRIGYVPQKGMLLSGTILDNLRTGVPDAEEAVIRKALKIAQAEAFIAQKEGGLSFRLAQGATNVSGGQKQRISIARALVKQPEILIFDDSFSALDFKTDAALRQALHQEAGNATFFIVGQRVATIMNADQIVVLEQGRIAGIGTHRQLLKTCPVYTEIAASQLSPEELA